MTNPVEPLPAVDAAPGIASVVGTGGRAVVVAPPGTGKSTALPSALLDRLPGRIFVTQPRRLAARMLARRVASIRNVELGGEVGFATRTERREGGRTRLCYLTEGLLLRRMLGAHGPGPDDLVVLDEFHERSIDADLLFGILRERRSRVLVSSATLDAASIGEALGAEIFSIESRIHPVEIHHRRAPSAEPVWDLAAEAVRETLRDISDDGDLLVFMPGRFEIDRTIAACRRIAEGCEVLPLHGGLPAAAQDAAVSGSGRRKIVVATNIAETSITIPRVTTVIDSGIARIARFDRERDLDRLVTEPVSRASAVQRAGRAGRVRPGRCRRLYTETDFLRRDPHEAPAIRREDLAGPFLRLRVAGFQPEAFPWLDPPEPLAATHADAVLDSIDAVRDGVTTEDGRRIASLPVPPRVGRFLLDAGRRGGGRLAAACAAILGERDVAPRASAASLAGVLAGGDPRSDLVARARLILAGERRGPGIDPGAMSDAISAARQLERLVGRGQGSAGEEIDEITAIVEALVAAFPDRVAYRRDRSRDECVLPGRRNVMLGRGSIVRGEGFLIASSIRGARHRGRETTVLELATAIDETLVKSVMGKRFGVEHRFSFDVEHGRVERIEARTFDDLRIDERRSGIGDTERTAAAACLLAAIEDEGIAIPGWSQDVEAFIDRVDRVAAWFPDRGVTAFGLEDLQVLRAEIVGRRHRIADLPGSARILEIVRSALDWSDLQFVDRMAPTRVQLPRGRTMRIEWRRGEPPRGSARIGDLVDLERTPTVAGGRVPIVLEILAPNSRPVQVTDDLEGFWTNTYPGIRKELRRRYPRHPWP